MRGAISLGLKCKAGVLDRIKQKTGKHSVEDVPGHPSFKENARCGDSSWG